MAPTTLPGRSRRLPDGRDVSLAATRSGLSKCSRRSHARLSGRVSVHEPKAIMNAKKAIRKAFKFQIDKTCFSLIEVVSTCRRLGQQPHEACEWLEEHMLPYFPLGDVKTPEAAH